jgi:hypothetical protein
MNKNLTNFVTLITICFIVSLYFVGKKRNDKPIGYVCKTVEEGNTLILKAPKGTHFTKLVFADFGTLSACPNPTYGTCTSSKSNFPNFPFDVAKNKINGKDVNGATLFDPIIMLSSEIGDPCPGKDKYTTVKLEYIRD